MTIVTSARARLHDAIVMAELPNYVYGYPSKRAYRPLAAPPTVADVWRDAPAELNLYAHIPFCSYRCAFCTLFLTTSQTPSLVDDYIDALIRQINMYGELLVDQRVVSIYVGGGTPTTLTPAQFRRFFAAIDRWFPHRSAEVEFGVEGSPDTMTPDRLRVLRQFGVNRISMGIQTLDQDELERIGRPYPLSTVDDAVAAINEAGFDNVNYDLIYGLEGQTEESWLRSLERTLAYQPTTITLYPVVFRPLTVIDRRHRLDEHGFAAAEAKYHLYDLSVAALAQRGYRQDSLVRFTTLDRDGYQQEAADFSGVPLLGLGAGARSYAERVHYGTDFAVGRKATNEIIAGFVGHDHRPDERLSLGFELDDDEQQRRFIILTLSLGRLDPLAFSARFPGGDLGLFIDEFDALLAEGCTSIDGLGRHCLTAKGFKYSSVIATLFRSPVVESLEEGYVPA